MTAATYRDFLKTAAVTTATLTGRESRAAEPFAHAVLVGEV